MRNAITHRRELWPQLGRLLALGCVLVAMGGAAAAMLAPQQVPFHAHPKRDGGDGHIALHSAEGERLLEGSAAKAGAIMLLSHLETQKTQVYCGPASIVAVLNALDVPAPVSEPLAPHPFFTQDNLFPAAGRDLLDRADVERRGMSLAEIAPVFERFGATARTVYAQHTTLDAFRADIAAALSERRRYVVANYDRAMLGQNGRGHISPLAAYDAASDRVLILDVARYKHPPVWTSAAALFSAMAGETAPGLTRGYVIVSAP